VYLPRMRSASALRFSKGCSSLNLERMVMSREVRRAVVWCGLQLDSEVPSKSLLCDVLSC